MATNKMTRKTVHVQPELHSLHRLGHQVKKVKNELTNANTDKAIELARTKILDSPNTNKTFKKSVAKRVDVRSEEKLFNQMTKLDISELEDVKKAKKKVIKQPSCGKKDPEPCLSDFHQPYQGEYEPLTKDITDSMAKLRKKLYKEDTEIQQKINDDIKKFYEEFDE